MTPRRTATSTRAAVSKARTLMLGTLFKAGIRPHQKVLLIGTSLGSDIAKLTERITCNEVCIVPELDVPEPRYFDTRTFSATSNGLNAFSVILYLSSAPLAHEVLEDVLTKCSVYAGSSSRIVMEVDIQPSGSWHEAAEFCSMTVDPNAFVPPHGWEAASSFPEARRGSQSAQVKALCGVNGLPPSDWCGRPYDYDRGDCQSGLARFKGLRDDIVSKLTPEDARRLLNFLAPQMQQLEKGSKNKRGIRKALTEIMRGNALIVVFE